MNELNSHSVTLYSTSESFLFRIINSCLAPSNCVTLVVNGEVLGDFRLLLS